MKETCLHGERDIHRPPVKNHKAQIIEVIKSNLMVYRSIYLQELENEVITRSKEHDNILEITPLIAPAYKNLLIITKMFIINNILPNHAAGIRWKELSKIEQSKYALCYEDILFRSGYRGVSLHRCDKNWASFAMLAAHIRSFPKDDFNNGNDLIIRTSTDASFEAYVDYEEDREEANYSDQSMQSGDEVENLGSFFSTQDSQPLVDLLGMNHGSGQKRPSDVDTLR
ncbi:hypothetical protein G6F56_012764 [Rhizopus delemar]|nr:hypothetical protein G6F56_012764 [Rhizopus delemar]